MAKRKKNTVSEPDVVYTVSSAHQTSNNEIIVSSLKDQEEANYRYWLSLSPEKRFELHYKMITHFFADELKKKRSTRKISFS
jgi:hypothetical protein